MITTQEWSTDGPVNRVVCEIAFRGCGGCQIVDVWPTALFLPLPIHHVPLMNGEAEFLAQFGIPAALLGDPT